MPHNPDKPSQSEQDELEKIIVIREDSVFNYTDIIDKIAMRKQPYVTKLLRRHEFALGKYRIRNGMTKRLTGDELEILSVEKVLWIKLTNEQAKEIIGAEGPPVYGTYLRDLWKYLHKHDLAYMNHPQMFLYEIKGFARPIQHNMGDYE